MYRIDVGFFNIIWTDQKQQLFVKWRDVILWKLSQIRLAFKLIHLKFIQYRNLPAIECSFRIGILNILLCFLAGNLQPITFRPWFTLRKKLLNIFSCWSTLHTNIWSFMREWRSSNFSLSVASCITVSFSQIPSSYMLASYFNNCFLVLYSKNRKYMNTPLLKQYSLQHQKRLKAQESSACNGQRIMIG